MLIILALVLKTYSQLSLPLTLKTESQVLKSTSNVFEANNLFYVVEVFLGNPSKKFDLLINTKSEDSWVEQIKCKSCAGFKHQYNPGLSQTYKNLSTYVSATVFYNQSINRCQYRGRSSSDFITLPAYLSTVSVRINFTLAQSDSNCQGLALDGSLNLGPYAIYQDLPVVYALKQSNEIPSAVFAIFINNFTMTDKKTVPSPSLQIGGYNLSYYSSDPSSLFFMQTIQNSVYWTVMFDSISFGMWGDIENVTVMLSSTIRYINGDINAYMSFLPYLSLSGLTCEEFGGSFIIKCKKNKKIALPGFTFGYLNNSVELSNYTIWNCDDKVWCTLLIEFNRGGNWVFGQLFLESYFTIFNYDNQSIGFAPAAKSKIINDDDDDSFSVRLAVLSLLLLT